MTFFVNVSELAHELRHAAGTVLTILGSHLEAQERARVDEVGPQWLTEFEEQRDSLEAEQLFECVQPDCGCHDDVRYTPIPDDVCDEADNLESADEPACEFHGQWCAGETAWCADYRKRQSSAAVSAAADPSPADVQAAGDEGPEGASAIPPAAPSGQPTDPGAVAAPAPGEQVREDDLAAHITATLNDIPRFDVSSELACSLLTDFNITRK